MKILNSKLADSTDSVSSKSGLENLQHMVNEVAMVEERVMPIAGLGVALQSVGILQKAIESPGVGFHGIPSDWNHIDTPSRQRSKKGKEDVSLEIGLGDRAQPGSGDNIIQGKVPQVVEDLSEVHMLTDYWEQIDVIKDSESELAHDQRDHLMREVEDGPQLMVLVSRKEGVVTSSSGGDRPVPNLGATLLVAASSTPILGGLPRTGGLGMDTMM